MVLLPSMITGLLLTSRACQSTYTTLIQVKSSKYEDIITGQYKDIKLVLIVINNIAHAIDIFDLYTYLLYDTIMSIHEEEF